MLHLQQCLLTVNGLFEIGVLMSDLTFRGGNVYRTIHAPTGSTTHAESIPHFTDGDPGVYDWRAINAFADTKMTPASNNPFKGFNYGADGVPSAHPGGNTAAQYLQWEIWSGANNPTHAAAGTAVYPSPYVTGLTEETWYSDKVIVTTSYNKASGGLGYAFEVDGDSDFCLNSNSSDGATINANGGYTFFMGMYNYSPNTGWGRPYNIYGFSSRQGFHNNTTNPGSFEYAGPLIFYNQNTGPYQLRRSAANNSYAGYSYFGITGRNNAANSMLFVIRVTTGGAAKVDYWLGDHTSGTAYSTAIDSTMSWLGATDYGVYATSTNSARPFFCDSQYWSNGADPAYIHCAGIINHPLNATDAQSLLNGMKAVYV